MGRKPKRRVLFSREQLIKNKRHTKVDLNGRPLCIRLSWCDRESECNACINYKKSKSGHQGCEAEPSRLIKKMMELNANKIAALCKDEVKEEVEDAELKVNKASGILDYDQIAGLKKLRKHRKIKGEREDGPYEEEPLLVFDKNLSGVVTIKEESASKGHTFTDETATVSSTTQDVKRTKRKYTKRENKGKEKKENFWDRKYEDSEIVDIQASLRSKKKPNDGEEMVDMVLEKLFRESSDEESGESVIIGNSNNNSRSNNPIVMCKKEMETEEEEEEEGQRGDDVSSVDEGDHAEDDIFGSTKHGDDEEEDEDDDMLVYNEGDDMGADSYAGEVIEIRDEEGEEDYMKELISTNDVTTKTKAEEETNLKTGSLPKPITVVASRRSRDKGDKTDGISITATNEPYTVDGVEIVGIDSELTLDDLARAVTVTADPTLLSVKEEQHFKKEQKDAGGEKSHAHSSTTTTTIGLRTTPTGIRSGDSSRKELSMDDKEFYELPYSNYDESVGIIQRGYKTCEACLNSVPAYNIRLLGCFHVRCVKCLAESCTEGWIKSRLVMCGQRAKSGAICNYELSREEMLVYMRPHGVMLRDSMPLAKMCYDGILSYKEQMKRAILSKDVSHESKEAFLLCASDKCSQPISISKCVMSSLRMKPMSSRITCPWCKVTFCANPLCFSVFKDNKKHKDEVKAPEEGAEEQVTYNDCCSKIHAM